jgi:adenylosuccinate lyase
VPQLASISPAKLDALRDVHRNFTVADAQKIKATEAITNHDVKAVEYFLKVCHG